MDQRSTYPVQRYPIRLTSVDSSLSPKWSMPVNHTQLPLKDDLWAQSRYISGWDLIHAAHGNGAYPMGESYTGAKKWDWVLPKERAVLLPYEEHESKTTKYQRRKADWKLTFNTNLFAVLNACAEIERKPHQELADDEEEIEWLDETTRLAFMEAWHHGYAYSVEAWNEAGDLVGGLFGLHFSNYCTVESMFSKESGTSKACVLLLAKQAWWADMLYLDFQEWSDHLGTLGCRKMDALAYQDMREVRPDAYAEIRMPKGSIRASKLSEDYWPPEP